MTDNGLKAYYLDIYKELNKSVIVAKQLVKCALPFKKDIQGLIKEISKTRKKLDKIFFHPELYKICNECHKQYLGGCCKGKTDSHMRWGDLIYLISKDFKFQLPYPDIKFLTSLEKPACIFLGPNGCLLKEDRPIECLTYICGPNVEGLLYLGIQNLIASGILDEKELPNLSTNLNNKTRILFIHISSKNKISFNNNLLREKGLAYVTDFLE